MKVLGFAAAVALFGAGVASPAAGQSESAAMDAAYKSAVEAFAGGDLERAAEIVRPAIVEFEASFEDGVDVYCSSSTSAALAYMAIATSENRKAVAVTASYCRARFLLAYKLADERKLAEAESAIRSVLQHDPFNPNFLNELGYVQAESGNLTGAMETFLNAEGYTELLEEPDRSRWLAESLRKQGWVLIEQAKWDEAEAAFNKSLEIEPDHPMALSELEYIAENRDN